MSLPNFVTKFTAEPTTEEYNILVQHLNKLNIQSTINKASLIIFNLDIFLISQVTQNTYEAFDTVLNKRILVKFYKHEEPVVPKSYHFA